MNRIGGWALVLAVRVLFLGIRLLPVRVAGALGAGIGRAAYLLLRRHRRIALGNLARIYPGRGRRWRAWTARESFAELGRSMFELPHVFLRSRRFLLSRVRVEGEAVFRRAMERGDGVVLIAAHHCNWELGALMFSMLGYGSSIIYRPMEQEPLEYFLRACRQRFGAVMRPRTAGMRWLREDLRAGRSIAVMIDQHMSQGEQVPFLGHLANSTTLPAAVVRKYGVPLFGVAIEREGRGFSFRLRFWPIPLPEREQDRKLDLYRATEAIHDSYAPVIHRRPELWMWLHRRWYILEHDPALAEAVHAAP
ncbi:MAG: lauroyl acyltransferase [Zetaproteobacteria bacterium]|nr:MAG: lauroyl acyltransferase [Zetaproteobacteria bacterium]